MRDDSRKYKASPAGRRYIHFLTKLNSGDPDAMGAYVQEYFDEKFLAQHPVDEIVSWCMETYRETGGLNIYHVHFTEDYHVTVVTKAKSDGTLYQDTMKINDKPPHKIIEYFHEQTE